MVSDRAGEGRSVRLGEMRESKTRALCVLVLFTVGFVGGCSNKRSASDATAKSAADSAQDSVPQPDPTFKGRIDSVTIELKK